jgi:hypothetical protein
MLYRIQWREFLKLGILVLGIVVSGPARDHKKRVDIRRPHGNAVSKRNFWEPYVG